MSNGFRAFTFSLLDDRYPKTFCTTVVLCSEASAREHAQMHLGASPHFVSVEVDEDGILLFTLGQPITRRVKLHTDLSKQVSTSLTA